MQNILTAMYAVVGIIYSAVFMSSGSYILRYFDSRTPVDMSMWPVWGIALLLPAVIAAVVEKLMLLADMREHESFFDTDPVTTIIEMFSQTIPMVFRGVMWGACILVGNVIVDYLVDVNFLLKVATTLGLEVVETGVEF